MEKGSALEWRIDSKKSSRENDWFGMNLLKMELLKVFPRMDARPPERQPACIGGSSG